jgi:nitrate/nitrite transporter NarK
MVLRVSDGDAVSFVFVVAAIAILFSAYARISVEVLTNRFGP